MGAKHHQPPDVLSTQEKNKRQRREEGKEGNKKLSIQALSRTALELHVFCLWQANAPKHSPKKARWATHVLRGGGGGGELMLTGRVRCAYHAHLGPQRATSRP